jgi:polyribonucleotide nucleotidyltransferase
MREVIAAPRPEISLYAPRIITLLINPEKVGEVIGPGGKVIKRIVAQTKCKIDIEEGGKIIVASTDMQAVEKALSMIREITAEAELGQTYTGKIVRLEEYGAFVEILPNIQGLLHISEVAPYRIRNIRDVLKLGQTITVKVISIDEDNKVRVSRKALEEPAEHPPDGAEGGPAGEGSEPRSSHSDDRPRYSGPRSQGSDNRPPHKRDFFRRQDKKKY